MTKQCVCGTTLISWYQRKKIFTALVHSIYVCKAESSLGKQSLLYSCVHLPERVWHSYRADYTFPFYSLSLQGWCFPFPFTQSKTSFRCYCPRWCLFCPLNTAWIHLTVLDLNSSSTDYAVIKNAQHPAQAAQSASEELCECASVLAALTFALHWLI